MWGVISFSTDETEALKHKRASLGSLSNSNWMTHLTHSKQVFLYQRDLIFLTPCYEKAVYAWCVLTLLLLLLKNVLDQLTTYSFLFLQQLFLLFVRMLEYKEENILDFYQNNCLIRNQSLLLKSWINIFTLFLKLIFNALLIPMSGKHWQILKIVYNIIMYLQITMDQPLRRTFYLT